MDKNVKNLKRRILNGIARHEREDIYLTEEHDVHGRRIASVYYTPVFKGLCIKLRKYVVKRNKYEPAGEQFFDVADIQKALNYVAKFVNK